MNRADLLKYWELAETSGLWYASFRAAVDGLTATEAAWTPQPSRHSIWQLVHHVIFWREYTLRLLAGEKPDQAEIDRCNFAAPPASGSAGEAEWRASVQRFHDSHRRVAAAIADEKNPTTRLAYHLFHDGYHVGQIMYLRAMQGLKPVE
jgi:hypothetical protein